MDYRKHDKDVWERIFREAPVSWLSTPPSALMVECGAFLREEGTTRVLDLGSGFGRWTHFISREARCWTIGIDYALGGCRLGLKLASPSRRSSFVAGEITALPFADSTFDAFVAILILDNVAQPEGGSAVSELTRVTRSGAPGFVVLNPWPMPVDADTQDNPTGTCTRCDYSDQEAITVLFSRWRVLGWERSEHGLRVFRIRT